MVSHVCISSSHLESLSKMGFLATCKTNDKHETSRVTKKNKFSVSFSFGPRFCASNRIKNELKHCLRDRNPPCHCSGGPVVVHHNNSDDLFKWNGVIMGPSDCPFEGGVFFLSVVLPSDYPLKPPLIKFTTKVFHPNIDESGNIQLSILRKQYWTPALTIMKTLLSICSILTDPDTGDYNSNPISAMYRTNRDQYDKIAREWTRKYAME